MGSSVNSIIGLDPLESVKSAIAYLQEATKQEQELDALLSSSGDSFPGSDYRQPADRKTWMARIGGLRLHSVVWPGTHDSATNGIGNIVTRPFVQCQTLSIYEQLTMGCRVLDVRVQKDRLVCHGVFTTYSVEVVFGDIRRFLSDIGSETEIVILEIRTEFGQEDPLDFDKFIINQLGHRLIRQDDQVFHITIAELLLRPGRVICVWKPRQAPPPNPGGLLWSAGYLRDDWIDTALPKTKFDSNLHKLSLNPPVWQRKYFYRVENTATPNTNSLSSLLFLPTDSLNSVKVEPVTRRIHRFARLFIAQPKGQAIEKLQIFSTDFIDVDFVDACISLSHVRLFGK